MSQTRSEWPAEDRAAAEAVVRHHAQLAEGLDRRAESLLSLAELPPGPDGSPDVEQAHRELLGYLHRELLPHAHAEEETMYPAAAAQPGGALLVEGMLGEHRAILTLVDELAGAASPVRAAAAARALAALFAAHLAKENDLVLPLLAETDDVSLASLLEGMHTLLGGAEHPAPR